MLYLSSYMKSQSDAKGPLTVQIDNNNSTNSPVHRLNNRSGGELPPHLRYEQHQQQQQLLSPASTIATGTAGSVTAVDSDYDLPPEERQILSLSHSPSPAYQQPHLHQLTRLNQPNFQPSPVTRGPRSDLSNSSKTGGSFMNQATLANFTRNSTASNCEPTSTRVLAPKMAFNHQHNNHHLNNQQLYHSSYNSNSNGTSNNYNFSNSNSNNNNFTRQQVTTTTTNTNTTSTTANTSCNNFQSPVSGKLFLGETSSIYSVPKSGKVSSPKSNFTVDSVKKASSSHFHQQPRQIEQRLQQQQQQQQQLQQQQLQRQHHPQPVKSPISTMTDREQKELDQLLRDMYQELATFPDYNTIRPTARSVSSHQQAVYNGSSSSKQPFARSISHSPSVSSRSKPSVLHYVPRTEEQILRGEDTVDSGAAVYATLASKGQTATESSGCLPSSPSVCDRESRGMSVRSVTLTPTPVRPLFATQHSLVTSTPKPVIVTDAPASPLGPPSQAIPGFKGTHVVPGAKIGDQEAANRVGVYASTLGKKNLSSQERQELDDLINVMMEEVRNFPDYSTTSRKSASGRSQSTSNRVGYLNGSISNLDEVGVEATPTQGVARTRAVFESVHSNQPYTHSNGNRSPSPGGRSRQSHFSNRGEREKSWFSSGPTRTASISPVRVPFNRGNSVVSGRSISTGRYPDRSSIGTAATIVTQRAPSAASLLTASLNPPYGTAGGVLAQPSTEPLPPHLLTRPTQWCKDERSRPYHARADSRPFTYGVTSASPMIQRRRVHSESTAYVVENKPRPEPVVDYDEPPRTNGHSSSHSTYAAGTTRGLVRSPVAKSVPNSNIYDDPSELEREMDAISEISYNSGDTVTAADASSPMSWLEKQQVKLKAKKDTSDMTYQEQKGKSKAMLNELTRTMSGSRVPAYDEVNKHGDSDASSPVPPLRPPSPPKSRLIERLNLVNGNNGSYLSGNNCSSTAPVSPVTSNFPRAPSPSKSKSVTLLTEDGEIVDTEGRPATPGRPMSSQQQQHQHQQQERVPSFSTFSSGPTPRSGSPMRYASFLHNNNNESRQKENSSPVKGDAGKEAITSASEPTSPIAKSVSSPIYASVNLIDKHRISANTAALQEENA